MNKNYFKKLSLTLLAPALLAPVATIVSCSSVKSDLQLATDRVVQFLNDNIFIGRYDPDQFLSQVEKDPMISPGINLGFKTTLEKLYFNSDKGQLTLRVKLERSPKEVNDFTINLNGFNTEIQKITEQKIIKEANINSGDIFNGTIKTWNKNATFPSKLDENILLSYIQWSWDDSFKPGIGRPGGGSPNIWNSKFSPQSIGIIPEFKDIKPLTLNGVETDYLEFKVRLFKDGVWTNWTKHTVRGFYAQMEKIFNIDFYIRLYDSYLKEGGDPYKKPSEIKRKEEIPIPIYQRPFVTVNEIVKGSANDKEGSIIVDFKFTIDGETTKNAPIKIYGYKATG